MAMAMNFTLVLGYFLILACLLIAAVVFLGLWAKEDAKERGMESPVMWGLVVALVPNAIGLIIYLVVRSVQGRAFPCPACGYRVKDSMAHCPRCGAKQPPYDQLNPAPADANRLSRKRLRVFIVLLCVFLVAMLALPVLGLMAYRIGGHAGIMEGFSSMQ